MLTLAQQEPAKQVNDLFETKFGRDHRSLLLYIETRVVDNLGRLQKQHLRCNPRRHVQFAHEGGWNDEHSTRWATGVEPIKGHDDWDCIDDLVDAGLVIWDGTGTSPVFKLTDLGWMWAHRLRRERAERNVR